MPAPSRKKTQSISKKRRPKTVRKKADPVLTEVRALRRLFQEHPEKRDGEEDYELLLEAFFDLLEPLPPDRQIAACKSGLTMDGIRRRGIFKNPRALDAFKRMRESLGLPATP